MMFTPTSFWKSASRRNLDPNPVACYGWRGRRLSPEALQHLQAGAEAEKQRHFDVAIAEFKKATELAPTLATAFVNLGQAYMERQDYGAAIAPLKRAVELSPDLAAAHQLLGYALLAQGYNAEAIPHLEKVQEQTALGIAQIGTGQLQASGRKSPGRAGPAPQRSRFALLSWSRQRAAFQAVD